MPVKERPDVFFQCSSLEQKKKVIQDATFTFPQARGVRVMLSILYKSQTSAAHCQAT